LHEPLTVTRCCERITDDLPSSEEATRSKSYAASTNHSREPRMKRRFDFPRISQYAGRTNGFGRSNEMKGCIRRMEGLKQLAFLSGSRFTSCLVSTRAVDHVTYRCRPSIAPKWVLLLGFCMRRRNASRHGDHQHDQAAVNGP
jgi:hypothetical protein